MDSGEGKIVAVRLQFMDGISYREGTASLPNPSCTYCICFQYQHGKRRVHDPTHSKHDSTRTGVKGRGELDLFSPLPGNSVWAICHVA